MIDTGEVAAVATVAEPGDDRCVSLLVGASVSLVDDEEEVGLGRAGGEGKENSSS